MLRSLLCTAVLMILVFKIFAVTQEVSPSEAEMMHELRAYAANPDPQMKDGLEMAMFSSLLKSSVWPRFQKGFTESCEKNSPDGRCDEKLVYLKPYFTDYMNTNTPVEVIKKMPKCMPDITDQQFCVTMMQEVLKVYKDWLRSLVSQLPPETSK